MKKSKTDNLRVNQTNTKYAPMIYRQHEIVKYRPEFYKNHIYTKNEWTDFCDIGKSFDGEVLTLEEYLRVEIQYVNAIMEILQKLGNPPIKISYLEKYSDLDELIAQNNCYDDLDLLRKTKKLKRGMVLDYTEVPDIIRIAIRNYSYLRLFNREHQVSIQFGECCYVYFSCHLNNEILNDIASRNGLYLNPR